VNERTRVLVAAILSCVAQKVKSTAQFFKMFKSLIPIASRDFPLWHLILMKCTYDIQSVNMSLFYDDGVHVLFAELILHRAAAIAFLFCFMESTVSTMNLQLVLMAPSALVDISYLVRYHLLIFGVKLLSTHQQEFLTSLHKIQKIQAIG
jgi:hypothetical protein